MKIEIMSLALATILIVACEKENKKVVTESGLEVLFLKNAEGKTMAAGDIASFNFKLATETDSVIQDSKDQGPIQMPYDTAEWKRNLGLLFEAFNLCTEGDSITFNVLAEELFRQGMPPGITKESEIKFYLSLDKILTEEVYLAEQKAQFADQFEQQFQSRVAGIKQSAAEQLKIDAELLDKYFAKNNIQAETTDSGLRYVMTQEGSGPNAAAGDMLEAHYHGTLLDGTKFDSSYDKGKPLPFRLREGRVILGWDEGFGLLNTGAKATLYIPSSLAYGGGGQGIITANSILKFDVELLGIK